MPQRQIAWTLLPIALVLASCSSGLGDDPRPDTRNNDAIASRNLPVGLDLGVVPNGGVTDLGAAGAVIPGIGGGAPRELALVGFSASAPSNNADGAGRPLSRDATADANGVADVFVAVVSAQDVEPTAFSQSLAGKFRHPRCTTCHSMQVPGTLAFASSPQPHAGPAPGAGFPADDPAACSDCHVVSTNDPVPGWQAPDASFDLRTKTVAQLAEAAQQAPGGELVHFFGDKRVLWALDSGVLPRVGDRNGAADDDHDGVLEPEDTDGVIRTVPGGSAQFLQEIRAWIDNGRAVTCADAVKDVTLVSRATGTSTAANGASTAPRLLYVPNPGFNPSTATTARASNPAGTVYVAFVSTANDLVPGVDANSFEDVYRATVEVRVEEDENGLPLAGGLNLRLVPGAMLAASARNGTILLGNGAASNPAIGGPNGEIVAFESVASNLVTGFVDRNGAGNPDVYVRNLAAQVTTLVSHQQGIANAGANGTSLQPSLSSDGAAIAFASDASDLAEGDTNGVRDVYHLLLDALAPFTLIRSSVTNSGLQGTGGDSQRPSIVRDGAQLLVAFESTKIDLAPGLLAPSNVYVHDAATGNSILVNQRATATGNAVGDGSATHPAFLPGGEGLVFLSAATNLDVLRPDGNRKVDLFLVETAPLATGRVLPYRISVTGSAGADANGDARPAVVGQMAGGGRFRVGLAVWSTSATNLATSDSNDVLVSFLDETSGVLAGFTASTNRGAVPLAVAFTDNSSGDPTSWSWDFDNDGTFDSTERNPTFTYTTPGTYSVRLVARNARSEGEQLETNLILAVGTPEASFTASVTSGVTPLAVAFTDTSTQFPTSWAWDFDNDGLVDSTLQNPTFAYTTPGTYSVRLVATNEAGSGTLLVSNLIEAYQPVVAGFTRAPATGIVPFTVTFTNTSTGATTFEWDFNEDGITDSTQVNPQFNYTTTGVFDVRLRATGPGGTSVFTFPDCVTANGLVNASFTITVAGTPAGSAYSGTTVQFTSTSTGPITSFAWDFDNNPATTESTLQNPTRVFNDSVVTTRTIRLTVTGTGVPAGVATASFTTVPLSETVVLSSVADTTIYSNNTSNSNGLNVHMVAGSAYLSTTGPTFGFRRALVRFDLSPIPSASTIQSASLGMTAFPPPGLVATGPQAIQIQRVARTWTEGTTNSATLATPVNVGIGALATGGDATWLDARSGSVAPPITAIPWTNQGGDFSSTVTASTVVDLPGLYTWTSPTLAADVQLWINSGASANSGWIIRGPELAAARTAKIFGTKDNADPAARPRLTVSFRRPLP